MYPFLLRATIERLLFYSYVQYWLRCKGVVQNLYDIRKLAVNAKTKPKTRISVPMALVLSVSLVGCQQANLKPEEQQENLNVVDDRSEDGNREWIHFIGGTGRDHFASVIATDDGGCIAVGSSTSTDGDIPKNRGYFDAIITRFDVDGSIVWARSIGGSQDDVFLSVAQSASGNFVAVGWSDSNDGDISASKDNSKAIITLFGSGGDLIWVRSIEIEDISIFQSVICTFDDGFVAVGSLRYFDEGVADLEGCIDAIIVKFDSSGNLIWLKRVGGSGWESFSSVVQAGDGSLIAVGKSSSDDGDIPGNNGQVDAMIARFDESGNLIWVRNFGGSQWDTFQTVTLSQDGKVVASGRTSSVDGDILKSDDDSGAFVASFDLDGNIQHAWCFSNNEISDITSLQRCQNGSYVAVGVLWSDVGSNPDVTSRRVAIVVGLDPEYNLTWSSEVFPYYKYFASVTQTTDGSIVIVGSLTEINDYPGKPYKPDAIIIKLYIE